MASPLILRIVTRTDLSGVEQTQQAMKGLQKSVFDANIVAGDSVDEFKRLTGALGGTGVEAAAAGKSFNSSFGGVIKTLSTVRGLLRNVRLVGFIGGLVAAPLIAVTKATIDLERQTTPLITKLNQVGEAGRLQSSRLLDFAREFQKTQGVGVTQTLAAINVLVSKTRTAADAENTIATARKISLATGEDLIAVTTALADALNGNSDSLERITLKSKEFIETSNKAGTLVSDLGRAFEDDAARGALTFSNILSRLTGQIKSTTVEFVRTGGALKGSSNPFSQLIASAINFPIELAKGQQKAADLRDTLRRLGTGDGAPLLLRNFEEIDTQLKRSVAEVAKLEALLQNSNKLNEFQKADLRFNLDLRKQEVGVLGDLLDAERELSTEERLRARARISALSFRQQEQKLQRETGGQDFLLDPDVERRRQDLSKKEEEQVIESVRRQRDAIAAVRKLTADDELELQKELSVKLGEVRLREAERVRERERRLAELDPSQLAKLRAEEERAKKELVTTGRPRVTDAEVQFLRESNKIKRDGGRVTTATDEQLEASRKIEAIRQKLAQEKLAINLTPSFTPGVMEKLADAAASTFARVFRNRISQDLDNAKTQDNLSTAPTGGGE